MYHGSRNKAETTQDHIVDQNIWAEYFVKRANRVNSAIIIYNNHNSALYRLGGTHEMIISQEGMVTTKVQRTLCLSVGSFQ